ncbi:hypothetical protein ANCCEY_05082 [Ancylostoma ceylanicum]|uniref:Uncharacterized protein n=1 Tax=Ancylostoma ceylanicum TaxID=53326 RepID=A0A0D6M7K5_9BILA|nr:hypothetical protein ANCCEY_05082 [Ancylostoma ceylanicum]
MMGCETLTQISQTNNASFVPEEAFKEHEVCHKSTEALRDAIDLINGNLNSTEIVADDYRSALLYGVASDDLLPLAVLVSKFKDYIDLYISSKLCEAFLITAVTSTFGWWLAFFAPGQDAIYYMPDTRPHADKRPSEDLFLKTWKVYKG